MIDKPEIPSHLLTIPGPSATQDWLKCNTYWYLRQNWEPIGQWAPYIDLGKSNHKGLEILLNQGLDALQLAISESSDLMASLYQPNDDWTLDALLALLVKGLKEAAKTTIKDILEHEEVLYTELGLGYVDKTGHQHGTIDLLTRRGNLFIITDHKTRLKMEERWIQKELIEIETDWQLWDYAYRVRETFGASELAIRRHLVRLTPRTKCDLQEYPIRMEVLDRWAQGAQGIWNLMNGAVYLNPLPMNLTQCLAGRYGKCGFFEACHVANQDPTAMQILYQRRVFDEQTEKGESNEQTTSVSSDSQV